MGLPTANPTASGTQVAAGEEVVRLTGEQAWAGYLRRMLAAAAQ